MTDQTAGGHLSRGLANFFGGLGYLIVTLEWLLVGLVYFEWAFKWLPTAPTQPTPLPQVPVEPIISSGPPPIWSLLFLGAVTVIMIALSIYFVIKLPAAITRTGRKLVRKAAEGTAPLVLKARHRPDVARERRKLTPRLVAVFKLLLIVLPIGLALGTSFIDDKSLSLWLVMVIAGTLAAASLTAFIIQYGLAWLLKVAQRALW